jgi:hypothetical protein
VVIVQPTAEALDQREDLLAVSLLVARPASTEPANGPRAVSEAVRAVATDDDQQS